MTVVNENALLLSLLGLAAGVLAIPLVVKVVILLFERCGRPLSTSIHRTLWRSGVSAAFCVLALQLVGMPAAVRWFLFSPDSEITSSETTSTAAESPDEFVDASFPPKPIQAANRVPLGNHLDEGVVEAPSSRELAMEYWPQSAFSNDAYAPGLNDAGDEDWGESMLAGGDPARLVVEHRDSRELRKASAEDPAEDSAIAESSAAVASRANVAVEVRWWSVLVGLWFVVTGLLLLRLASAHLRWARIEATAAPDDTLANRVDRLWRQLGGRGRVRVVRIERLAAPVAFGILRPAIAAPRNLAQQLSESQQQAVMAHELAHVLYRDPAWQAVSDLLTAILWWHPGVWWLRRELREAAEFAADESAAVLPDGRRLLASSLVEVARTIARRPSLAAVPIEGRFRSALSRRVTRLLS